MAKTKWSRASAAEAAAILHSKGTKRVRPHNLSRCVHHWRACAYCGLMNLKNEATRKALKQKCVVWE